MSQRSFFDREIDIEDKLQLLESKVNQLESLQRSVEDKEFLLAKKVRTLERRSKKKCAAETTLSEFIAANQDVSLASPGARSTKTESTTDTANEKSMKNGMSSPPPVKRLRTLSGTFEKSWKAGKTLRSVLGMKRSEENIINGRRPSVMEDDLDEDDDYKDLSQDTFTLMILSKPCSKQWLYGLGVFFLQVTLLFMIGVDQYSSSKDSTPFNVPYKVEPIVHAGQILAIILSLATQTDLVMAIHTFMMLWTERRIYWTQLIRVPSDTGLGVWVTRIAFPITCKFVEGALVLMTTFVIVIQSSNIIDLFKDFAAMQLISELDNMMFWLALHGYVGVDLASGAKQARKIQIHDDFIKAYGGIPLRTLILFAVFLSMGGGWSYFVHGQISGKFFHLKYPKCCVDISPSQVRKLGDGQCDGGFYNTIECGFDDGDCITFNLGYPNCRVEEPTKIGDGKCDQDYNNKDCNYDGADCCPMLANDDTGEIEWYGDGICNGGLFNTEICDFDGGDCLAANEKYPDCPVLKPDNEFGFDGLDGKAIGDGKCDGGILNTKECGWDGGDCRSCNRLVGNRHKIGNGYCDGGPYMNLDECNDDGGDCISVYDDYDDECRVPVPGKLGDGKCDGGAYATEECKMDGGDCDKCKATYLEWVGDGICDGGEYMTPGCSVDGGDCDECLKMENVTRSTIRNKIGDGKCDIELNTTACGYDGHDCLAVPKPLPCIVPEPDWLGDWVCDGGVYNSDICSYDGGDCVECNAAVDDPSKIGDGYCDGGEYMNNFACNFDGQDCEFFYDGRFENCDAPVPGKLGDGTCDGGAYFSPGCLNDDGDCDDCLAPNPMWVGDGICDGGLYFDEGCSRDAGDCDACLKQEGVTAKIIKNNIGDGTCDIELNTTACGYDGYDCLPAKESNICSPEYEFFLGDGYCHGGQYNTKACDYDLGDCTACNEAVPDPSKIGDGTCDGGLYMVLPECNNDGHDCDGFLDNHPFCFVPFPDKVGDGFCNGGTYFTEQCDFDGGDCDKCEVTYNEWVGDGICDGGEYLSPGCSMDGGDCDECCNQMNVDVQKLGDGKCDIELNTTACGYDGYDCLEIDKPLPCIVPEPDWLGDGFCDGGVYNSDICSYDGGDCLACNAAVDDPSKIGNGYCDGGEYMRNDECYEDGQDCSTFLTEYPRCDVKYPEKVGDGVCDGGNYMTLECSMDGGDCYDCLRSTRADPWIVGDGKCDLELNTTACNYDGGDCLTNQPPPPASCGVDDLKLIGDGFCDGGDYYSEECSWEDGDCDECVATVGESDLSTLGDGYCDLSFNVTECHYDGFDCLENSTYYYDDEPDSPQSGLLDDWYYDDDDDGFDDDDDA